MSATFLQQDMMLHFLGIQGQEWILILVVVVLLFGASRIPDLAKSLGRAKGEYKKGVQEGAREAEQAAPDEHPDEKDDAS